MTQPLKRVEHKPMERLSPSQRLSKASHKISLDGFRFIFVSVIFSAILSVFILSQDSKAAGLEPHQVNYVGVMAPLTQIQNWDAFASRLKTLKENGVDSLTTDVWWGAFEAQGNNQFEWSYYKKYAQVVAESGLKWVPILSFHQCGGNIGDDCDIPLPRWVWSLASPGEMYYKDERGAGNREYVAPFYEGIYSQYAEAMTSFAENFKEYYGIITKIYISMGPSGELRYPSYVGTGGWTYPHRGYLNAYSGAAIRSFQEFTREKYGNIGSVNVSWGLILKDFSDINPPRDGDRFFQNGRNTPYGKDFLNWYQGVLEKHMEKMIGLAHQNISPKFSNGIPFGVKIAGVHWQYSNPSTPHAAENAAGFYDYESLLQKIKNAGAEVTFTCLEMDDSQKWSSSYSAPKTLVNLISSIANRIGLPISGENALAISNDNRRYDEIADVLNRYNYESFTLLRINGIVDEQGRPTQEMWPFKDKIIRKFFR